jgi:hypothetical protein
MEMTDVVMKQPNRTSISNRLLFIFSCTVLLFLSCKKNDASPSGNTNPPPIINTAGDTAKFITADYIELDKIDRISKFRSGFGHDYSDGFEHCRSMKHYFQPKGTVDWSAVKIFSPVKGTVVKITTEWAGDQIHIQPVHNPGSSVIIFHVVLKPPLAVGDSVQAGQQLGTHIGSQTMSDIAIGGIYNNIWKLSSYFMLINDSLFLRYNARGLQHREDAIISKEARDADSLRCNGESFGTEGTINNWVILQ